LLDIQNKIKLNLSKQTNYKIPKIIAVSKTFNLDHIKPLIDHGHLDFGENKVQEATEKWEIIKSENKSLKLHMVGKLQSNKVKSAIKIFDYIHSLDNDKLAKKISEEEILQKKKLKLFIQINIGKEKQKSGINIAELNDFYHYCKELDLLIVGLMCLPPADQDPTEFFKEMNILKQKFKLDDLSMGMSSDYLIASQNFSTYLRIGTSIFGKRN